MNTSLAVSYLAVCMTNQSVRYRYRRRAHRSETYDRRNPGAYLEIWKGGRRRGTFQAYIFRSVKSVSIKMFTLNISAHFFTPKGGGGRRKGPWTKYTPTGTGRVGRLRDQTKIRPFKILLHPKLNYFKLKMSCWIREYRLIFQAKTGKTSRSLLAGLLSTAHTKFFFVFRNHLTRNFEGKFFTAMIFDDFGWPSPLLCTRYKNMHEDPHQQCTDVAQDLLVSDNIRFMLIFAGIRGREGVKWERSRRNGDTLTLARQCSCLLY